MRSVLNVFFFLGLAIGLSSCSGKQNFSVASQSQAFVANATYNNKVDLLWIVDSSKSMSTHQQNLSKQLGAFIDVLNSKKIDYHIGITTMDMGAGGEKGVFVGTPRVITTQTPNSKQVFQTNVQVGENGSDVERGLEAMESALSASHLANENAGFLREDAQLAVIFVSNENDHSAGKPSDYATVLNKIKPGNTDIEPPKWMANFIGITQPNGVCFTRGDIADPGDRYIELVNISKGEIAEICSDDLTSALSNIRKRIVEKLVEFKIAQKPVVDSIRVYINNALIPNDATNGWIYQDRTASGGGYVISLHGTATPAADAAIYIDYKPER